MQKIQKLISLFIISLLSIPYIALAQVTEDQTDSQEEPAEQTLQAIIKSPDTVDVNRSVILDASTSIIPSDSESILYKWDFGDGNQEEGIEATHFFKAPGSYTITLSLTTSSASSESKKDIFVSDKAITLISDYSQASDKRIEGLQNFSQQNGVYMNVIQDTESTSEFISEEILAKKILESSEEISKSDQIIIWTQGNTGLNALSRVQQQISDTEKIDFSQKPLLVIKENTKEFGQYQRTFQTLKPNKIIIANEAGLFPVIESTSTEDIINRFETGGYDYVIYDETTGKIGIFNFMSYFVNFLIEKGIPDNTIVLILLLPVIATVIAFMKQIIGISTFGVYTPTILTLTFWMLGLKFAVITFILLLAFGAITRQILKKFRILYIPKMAIVLTIVALTLFAILTITVSLNLFDVKFISLTIFPLLIMSTLTEKFVSIQSEKGLYGAILIMAKTIIISTVALFIIGGDIDLIIVQFKWDFLRNFMLTYPESILAILVINFFLGKWTGLRLLEYVRFREVFRHVEE